MDIIQGTALCPPVNIYAGDYSDIKGSDIVIVTLGCARKPGQLRLDLAQNNVNIVKSVMPQAVKYAPDAIYVVVSNPVDIVTYAILKTTGLPSSHVFGSGTLLDSSRLRQIIANRLSINPKNVHAYVFGEHGESSMIPWSLTGIGGIPLNCFNYSNEISELNKKEIEDEVRSSGAKVISMKGATFYAIALSARHICRCILRDTKTIATLSGMVNGSYGINDICLSLPFIIDRNGISALDAPKLTQAELDKLLYSANTLKETISSLEI